MGALIGQPLTVEYTICASTRQWEKRMGVKSSRYFGNPAAVQ